MPFEHAVVLPIALSTAASGLYPADLLNLPLPSATPVPNSSTQTKTTVLIWGGASSVGSAAIQLARASSLRVLSTASPANHAFVKNLGAEEVFDYRSESVVQDLINVLKQDGRELVGVYDAISLPSSFSAVSSILDDLQIRVPVACVLPCGEGLKTERFRPGFGKAILCTRHPEPLFFSRRLLVPAAFGMANESSRVCSPPIPHHTAPKPAYRGMYLGPLRPGGAGEWNAED